MKVGVLTSGGDAPGMNGAIRAIVRTGLDQGWEMYGVRYGFAGLINGNITKLEARDVGGIMQHGGTVLRSSRCPEFEEEPGRLEAVRRLAEMGIEALVVIGGNGSQKGAHALARMGIRVIGIASTIDNDLYGADISIGVDTALNIALEAIDRLKVTASSHHRASFVEVMGRDCGYLALMVGLAGGAEAVVIPEKETSPEALATELRDAYRRGKTHGLVVVAEGAAWNVERLTKYFKERNENFGFEPRFTTLGHVQRGGVPSAFDRLLATRLGARATEHLAQGEHGVLIGRVRGSVAATPLSEVVHATKTLDPYLIELAEILAK